MRVGLVSLLVAIVLSGIVYRVAKFLVPVLQNFGRVDRYWAGPLGWNWKTLGKEARSIFFDLLCKGIGSDINYRLVADDWAHAIELAEDFVEQFLEYRIGNILKSLSRSSGSTPNEILYSILAPKDPESALRVPFKVKPTSVTFDIAECDPAVLDAVKRRGAVAKVILPEEEETPADAENS